jgi:hypothetical protein
MTDTHDEDDLVGLLRSCVRGEVELSSAQIRAAELLLKFEPQDQSPRHLTISWKPTDIETARRIAYLMNTSAPHPDAPEQDQTNNG